MLSERRSKDQLTARHCRGHAWARAAPPVLALETKMPLIYALALVGLVGVPCGLYAVALRNESWREEK